MSSSRIPCQRHLFNIPDDVCYLNFAYMSAQLGAVSRAGRESVALKEQPWRVGEEHWFARVEGARARFAQVVGATADDVALVPSASYGVGTAAQNCPVTAQQKIVLIAEQFPSCVYPWMRRAEDTGARIVTVARPSDYDWTSGILEQIDERCAVVAVPAFHWADGSRIDLVRIGQAVRRVGARLVLDLSQSAGASPIDVAAVDPDWLSAPTYKWLLGPYSMGFLYAAPRNHHGRPLEENWIARSGSDDFGRLVDYQSEYRAGARRYDVGERSNFALLPMVNAGLDQLLEWRIERIASTLAETTRRLAAIAEDEGFVAPPEARRAPHFLGLELRRSGVGGLPKDIVSRFREQGVHVGLRGDALRLSPHLNVSEEDLDRFAKALKSLA